MFNVSIEESEKLKRLQAKLSRQKKGSNNRYKTIKKIRKEYNHINNKKNDISNKIAHSILDDNKIVVMQDEQLAKWKQDGISGSKIQHSVLGRIKYKLSMNERVVILDRWFPTTKYCHNCGSKVELQLNDRVFECPKSKIKEDRDIHAANNMVLFYLQYIKLDRFGTNQTSKKPVRIAYNKFVSKFSEQEDTMSLALC